MKDSPERRANLDAFLAGLQNPGSPGYHRWLKPEEFGQRFGAPQPDIAEVGSWLAAQGLRVNRIAKGRGVIEFSGTAGAVGQAFHTEIHNYSVEGRDYWANNNDISVPDSVAALIEGVVSLNSFHDYQAGGEPRPGPVVDNSDDLKPQYRGASGRRYLAPADFASVYNVPSTYTGSGVTIAVVGDADFDTDDIDDFRARFGLPKNTPTKLFNGINPGTGTSTSEAVLDVTWSGAVAKDASIVFVGASSILLSEEYIVDNNLADIVTESFFNCERNYTGSGLATLNLINSIRAQAAAQGTTWVGIAGDSGPYDCENFHRELSYSQTPVLSVNALASSPYAVAVGGTQFLDTTDPAMYWSSGGAALGYIPEGAWNQSCMVDAPCFTSIVAGGGGQSTTQGLKPSWQAAVGVGPMRLIDNTRDLPDVSLSASWENDPYIICINRGCMNAVSFSFSYEGGTSAAAPSFAGILALVAQKSGGRLGAVNPVLYQLAANQFSQCAGVASPASGCVFNDITSGNTSTPGAPNADYPATVGYDMATGLGSVNVGNLLNLWNAGTPTKTTTQLSVSPTTFVHGTAAQVAVTVAPQSGPGVPSGSVALLANAYGLICPGAAATRTAPDGCVSLSLPALASGVSAADIRGLPGGLYTVTAAYGGDSLFAPSVSAPFKVVVSPEPITISFSVSSTFAPYGSAIGLAALIQGISNSGIPTGTVTFSDSSILCCTTVSLVTAAPNTSGSANATVTTLSPGSHDIAVSYSGDPSFNSGYSQTAITVQIQKASTSLAIANVCASVGSVLNATVGYSGAGNAPGGSVVFTSENTMLGSAPLNAQGTAQFTVPASIGALPAVIQAAYGGDVNYSPSGSVAVNVGLPDCAATMMDSATNAHPASVGGLASIYGSFSVAATATAPTPAWPTTLAGATVSITDAGNHTVQAQLYYVSPTQINLCVPSSVAAGPVTVTVGGSATSNQLQAVIQASSPAIFAAQTIAVSSDGSVSPPQPLGPITIPSQGELFLVLYATGVRNHSASSVVNVVIGNTLVGSYQVKPVYAGVQGAYPGLDQVNIPIPAQLAGSGAANVSITINDSSTGATLQQSNALALTFANP